MLFDLYVLPPDLLRFVESGVGLFLTFFFLFLISQVLFPLSSSAGLGLKSKLLRLVLPLLSVLFKFNSVPNSKSAFSLDEL